MIDTHWRRTATSYLATFQAMTSTYPRIEPKAILGDLVKRTPGGEGKWFVAAKSAGLLAKAAELASTNPCDPKTLTRDAAQDFAASKSEFAGSLASFSTWGYRVAVRASCLDRLPEGTA
jgi:hypothetical protein